MEFIDKYFKNNKLFKLTMLIIWVIITCCAINYHSMWRDEVRNFMIAINATNSIHIIGNAHPAVSYLIQKLGYLIFHTYKVLPVSSFIISFLAVFLVLFFSPFGIITNIAFIFGYFSLYEYTVMARNYGISMLLMIVLAMVFSSENYRYKLTGPTLFFLANTNVHSAIISILFSFMWPLCVWRENRWSFNENVRKILPAATMGCAGFIACVLTIYPPRYDDLAAQPSISNIKHYSKINFLDEITISPFEGCFYNIFGTGYISHKIFTLLKYISIISVFSCIFSLWGDVLLFSVALVTHIAFVSFFTIVYFGGYRHQSLWIVFIFALFWIYRKNNKNTINYLNKFGVFSLSFMLFVQILPSVSLEFHEIQTPNSRAREFAKLVINTPDLSDATIIASDDAIIESMPYYINNGLYIMMQRKFDRVVPYSSNGRLNYSMEDIIKESKRNSICTHTPSIVLIINDYSPNEKIISNIMDNVQDVNYRKYSYGHAVFTFSEEQKRELKAQSTEIARYPNGYLEQGFIAYRLNIPDYDVSKCLTENELSDFSGL
ncbi:hypothetical protein [Komagataeibacter sp. NFXK3]